MIHEDIDLSAPRPVLKNTSAQDGSNNSGFSSVNLMAASLNSRYQMSTKDTELNGQSIKSNQQDDDEVEETVVPYEEDKVDGNRIFPILTVRTEYNFFVFIC